MPAPTPLPVKRPLWLRLLLVLAIGVLYVTAIRPARAVFMTFTMQAVDVEALEKQGYYITQLSPVNRVFAIEGISKVYLYKAPLDVFFVLSLIFALLYDIRRTWIVAISAIHVSLWFIAFIAILFTPKMPHMLTVADAISLYINPTLTLAILPIWIFSTKKTTF